MTSPTVFACTTPLVGEGGATLPLVPTRFVDFVAIGRGDLARGLVAASLREFVGPLSAAVTSMQALLLPEQCRFVPAAP